MTEPFLSLVERIELAYERLGHQLGWRFLYSPARTLSPDTQLAFVGANQAGTAIWRRLQVSRPAMHTAWRAGRRERERA